MDERFNDIRPYNDSETVEAMHRIAGLPIISKVEEYLFTESKGQLASTLEDIRGVEDLQNRVMLKVAERILEKTTGGLTVSGLENFMREDGSIGRFLLLSTHRDIVLDPAFIQYVLHKNGLPYTEIAVGDNLMINPVISDVIRSNRMIKVIRNISIRDIYTASSLLSDYIRTKVAGGESSIWLAHRQGRTKNGRDGTEQGLVKMLDMSGKGSFKENFEQLPIMPVAISYEYESCGALKALELYKKEEQGFYKKQEGEDLNSMIQGIVQYKGRVHIEFCKPLTISEINEADKMPKNDKFRRLAEIVNGHLSSAFKLWPTNYAAADIIEGGDRFSNHYSDADRVKLIEHIKEETAGMPDGIEKRLLNIYAAPLL